MNGCTQQKKVVDDLTRLHEHLSQGGDGWAFDIGGMVKEAAKEITGLVAHMVKLENELAITHGSRDRYKARCGEMKSAQLSMEQLRQMATEPLKHWVWIENIESPKDSGYMRTHSDWSGGEYFCCGWPGVSWSFKYDEYGRTWLAYERKP